MSVNAGSFQDPTEAHGLAHYLEHMLFMGTEKFPSENEYRYFLVHSVNSWPRIQVIQMPTRRKIKPTITWKSQPRLSETH
jgi:predicted Zn-dependent peptidase